VEEWDTYDAIFHYPKNKSAIFRTNQAHRFDQTTNTDVYTRSLEPS